ncbi:hypothetical protein ABR737_40895 [Streptomyces sp. Edi2]|uniref:hypothetical protein n=1 Tax=Streptomyces sp. Edi2 TaxID=3162528 RepID=UPI0033062E7A
MAPLDFLVVSAFDLYYEERHRLLGSGGSDFLLVNLFRAPLGEPVSPEAVGELLERLGTRAGLDRRVGAHMARRAFASNVADAGGTPDKVQAGTGPPESGLAGAVPVPRPGTGTGSGRAGALTSRYRRWRGRPVMLTTAQAVPQPAGPASEGRREEILAALDGDFLALLGWDWERRVITFPRQHPVIGVPDCPVPDCPSTITVLTRSMCGGCMERWRGSELTSEEFLLVPKLTSRGVVQEPCAVAGCERPRDTVACQLCNTHRSQRESMALSALTWEEFLNHPRVTGYASLGPCEVAACYLDRAGHQAQAPTARSTTGACAGTAQRPGSTRRAGAARTKRAAPPARPAYAGSPTSWSPNSSTDCRPASRKESRLGPSACAPSTTGCAPTRCRS